MPRDLRFEKDATLRKGGSSLEENPGNEANDKGDMGHPGDLESKQATIDGMAPLMKGNLTAEPEQEMGPENVEKNSVPQSASGNHPYRDTTMENFVTYSTTLGLSNLEACIHVENSAFPPHETCSREKFEYRLNHCAGETTGIFTSAYEDTPDPIISALAKEPFSTPVSLHDPERKSILLGHCIATKSNNATVTDDDMALPTASHPDRGHKQTGRTICLHSVAVLPQFQGKGLGKAMVRGWLQGHANAATSDRVALLAHGELIPFYERFGFKDLGPSKATFGGGGWNDMVLVFEETPDLMY